MKIHNPMESLGDLAREAASNPRGRANFDFGQLNDYQLGMGRYIGESPWERHRNGDELLYVLSGEVDITLLDDEGEERDTIRTGSFFVVPKDRWHQLDTPDGASIFYASPPEDGAERVRGRPTL
jgi:mannose-6-phosphate isomerase-like protein (cupin superfamily)